jgi:hypothetical protein
LGRFTEVAQNGSVAGCRIYPKKDAVTAEAGGASRVLVDDKDLAGILDRSGIGSISYRALRLVTEVADQRSHPGSINLNESLSIHIHDPDVIVSDRCPYGVISKGTL